MMDKLVLGVFYSHNPTRIGNLELVSLLREEFKVILISNTDIPYLKGYCNELQVIPFDNINNIIDVIKKLHNKFGFDGLITLSENAVVILSIICDILGLRGNNPNYIDFSRNKYEMRKLLKKINISQPKFFKVSNLKEAKEVVKKNFENQSFFLKPPAIGGSSFCSIINDIEELEYKWDDFFYKSKRRTINDVLYDKYFGKNGEKYYLIIEELMSGHPLPYDNIISSNFPIYEVSVEGFINGNTTYIYSFTDKLLPQNYKYAEEHLWRMHSKIPKELKKILIKRVNKINKELKAQYGCSHTEFRIEKCDKYNADVQIGDYYYRARIIETALRIGGAFMQSAILTSTGFNSIKAMAYQACGLETNQKVLYRNPAIMANLWSQKEGIIKKIKGLDKILSKKHIISFIHIYDGIGDYTNVPPISNRGMGDVLLIDKSINLLEYKEWESLPLYNNIEKYYLDVINNFEVII